MPLPTEQPLELQWINALRLWLATETAINCVSYIPVATDATPILGIWIDSEFMPESNFRNDFTRDQFLMVVLSIRDNRAEAEEALSRWANYLIEDVFRRISVEGVPVGTGVGFRGIRPYAGNSGLFAKREYGAVGGDAASNTAIVDCRLRLQYSYTLARRLC